MPTFQYKVGFLTALQARYIPDRTSLGIEGESLCSSWISTACDLSPLKEADMLADSLLAMSLALVGREQQHQDMLIAALHYYSRALNELRARLRHVSSLSHPNNLDTCFATCLTCAMHEVCLPRSMIPLIDKCRWSEIDHISLL